MATTPTIAIGIGKAGNRMVSALSDVVEAENVRQKYKFISIDTNRNELYDESPDDTIPLDLELPDEEDLQERAIENFEYLNDNLSLSQGQGVTRQRPVSRYHIDNREQFFEVRRTLEQVITTFINDHVQHVDRDIADLNIWILNSLGGGTGSGAFPLVTAMVNKIIDPVSNYDIDVMGIGSLPRLDDIEDSDISPSANTEYYVNAYTALRELSELINQEDKPNHFPLTINVESDARNLQTNEYIIEESPFEKYLLLGFDEEEKGPSYRNQMNAAAARSIFYLSELEENFPDDDSLREETLFSVTASEITAPVDKAYEYLDYQEEISERNNQIEDVEIEIADLEEATSYLDELLSLSIGYEVSTSSIELNHVSLETIRRARSMATDFRVSWVEQDEFDIDDEINVLLDDLQSEITYKSIDESYVVEYIYCLLLEDYIDEQIAEHDFRVEIEKVWNDQMGEPGFAELEIFEDEPAIDKWENALEEFLFDRYQALQNQADNTSRARVLRRRRLEEQAAEKQDQLESLQDLYEEFKILRDLHGEARARKTSAKNALKDINNNLQNVLSENREKKRTLVETNRNRQDRMRALESEITDFSYSSNRTTIPFSDTSKITRDTLDEANSLAAMLDALLSKEDVAKAITNTLSSTNQLRDPVQDITTDYDLVTRSILAVITSQENVSEDTNLLGPDLDILPNQKPIENILSTEFYYFDEGGIVNSQDGSSIWFLGFFTPISLQNTSEFGRLHELYSDPAETVSSDLGGDYTDEDIRSRFAYPELIDELE